MEKTAPTEEIQVLIDVSGSMKQNDPNNLRVDAVKLLINLLPDQAKVSFWLFAEKTTLLLQTDSVDPAWREKALKTVSAIHSRGVYTHIEDAVQTVMQKGFTGSVSQNLVLLTDGMVDISKDIMVSADSRERVISEWIPRLQEKKIKVQTIALSDQADKELLEKLAFETGGWAEVASSAEQLQRLFLKTAQKISPKDTLPLVNNQFSIDGSIQEFSLVVFKSAANSATRLQAPDQQKLDKNSHLEGLNWLETQSYDLITVKKPQVGNWQVEAATDPDNQVMILTDLQLHLSDTPLYLNEKEALSLKSHLTEHGKLIDRPDFLNLVKFSVSIEGRETETIPLNPAEPGFFNLAVNDLPKGKHKLVVNADSQTFKREIFREFEVVSSPIKVEKVIDATHRQVTLEFFPDISVLDLTSVDIEVSVSKPGQPPASHKVEQKDGKWLFPVEGLLPGESIVLNFNVMAKSLDGHALTPALLPITIDDTVFSTVQPAVPTTESEQHQPEHQAEHDSHEEPAKAEHEPVADTHPEGESKWGMVIGILLAANILVGGIGFLVYKMLKKSNLQKQQQLLERLG